MFRSIGILFCVALDVVGAPAVGAVEVSPDARARDAHLRRPIAAVLIDDDRHLVVANRRSGTLSLIDAAAQTVVGEFACGTELTDVAAISVSGQHYVVTTDFQRRELILVRVEPQGLEVIQRCPVAPYPISISVFGDGSRCVVASLWSRCLTLLDLRSKSAGDSGFVVAKTLPLPFAPREQLYLAEHGRLLVGDAFGGRLAVLHPATGEIESVRELPLHNIRGLSPGHDGTRLLISHQILNELSPPRKSDITWGVLMNNGLRSIRIDQLLDPSADIFRDSRFIPLGDGSNGAGDPGGIAQAADGRSLVTLAGVQELAIVSGNGTDVRRIAVGQRPVTVAVARSGRRAWVVNQLSDTLTAIDLLNPSTSVVRPSGAADAVDETAGTTNQPVNRAASEDEYNTTAQEIAPPAPEREHVYRDLTIICRDIPLGPLPDLRPSDRGEIMFHNARMSHAKWYSCHSCHPDGHSNGLLADTLGDRGYGAPKRVLSLMGTRMTYPWGWNGNVEQLQDQMHQSVTSTMQGMRITDREANELVAFLHTLTPPPPLGRFDALSSGAARPATIERGRQLFGELGCASCHVPDTYTTAGKFDIGFTDELGNDRFNPPSLRGVSQRDALFHDRRAATLEEVFLEFGHQLNRELSNEELTSLVAFLRNL